MLYELELYILLEDIKQLVNLTKDMSKKYPVISQHDISRINNTSDEFFRQLRTKVTVQQYAELENAEYNY
jgi:hypothetical protein